MSSIVRRLDKVFYPEFSNNWDDELFRERILKEISSEYSVLDLGAGAGIVEAMNFKGHVRVVCGVDLDPRVVDNPCLDEGRVADAGLIPYPDESFDIVFADNVLEHLEKPEQVFREVARVLKRGGLFIQNTKQKSLHADDCPLDTASVSSIC